MPAILVPVDGSVHALKALHIACDLASKYGGQVALFHVLAHGKSAKELLRLPAAKGFGPKLTAMLEKSVENSSPKLPDNILKAIGEKILNEAAAKVHRLGLETNILSMESGDPAESILVAAKRAGANTIVMGCRGVSDAESSSFGSVSQTVFQKADCTCISVK